MSEARDGRICRVLLTAEGVSRWAQNAWHRANVPGKPRPPRLDEVDMHTAEYLAECVRLRREFEALSADGEYGEYRKGFDGPNHESDWQCMRAAIQGGGWP